MPDPGGDPPFLRSLSIRATQMSSSLKASSLPPDLNSSMDGLAHHLDDPQRRQNLRRATLTRSLAGSQEAAATRRPKKGLQDPHRHHDLDLIWHLRGIRFNQRRVKSLDPRRISLSHRLNKSSPAWTTLTRRIRTAAVHQEEQKVSTGTWWRAWKRSR